MPTLTSLPPYVLAHVLEFAVYGFTQVLGPSERHLPLEHLKDAALVCRNTLHAVRSLVSTFRATTMDLALGDSATADNVAAMHQTVETRGCPVRDLRMQLGDNEEDRYLTKSRSEALEKVEIQWSTVFGLMPGLKRLDLTKVSLLSKHLVQILETGATHCRHLEFLILPQQGNEAQRRRPKHRQGHDDVVCCYGEMVLDWRPTTADSSDAEYGGPLSRNEGVSYADAHCSEMWTISLDKWRAFNAKCTNLRDFNWLVVPFGDPFFHAFEEHVKPQLTSLSLSANMNWKYDRYFQDCRGSSGAANEGETESNPPGYGVSASDARAVLKACPALRRLSIDINCLQNNRPQAHYVNAAVYGDEFWEAAAEHCPLLQSIEMMDASNFQNFNVQSVSGLSDRTKGHFFEWLHCVSKLEGSVGPQRVLGVRLGGHQRTRLAPPSYYAEIVESLKLLSEISEESLGAASCRAKPLLYIVNPYELKVSRLWSKPYMRDNLRPMLEAVKAKHPSLHLSISMFGRAGDKFNRIDTLTLDWRPQEGERKRDLFFDYAEEQAERDTYLDASRYEIVSENEGDEDEEGGGDVEMEDLLLYRAIMARFIYGEDDDD
ncbi:hypothetical protein PHYPSEUDO_014392 [Phytophthora pseudosyringae]|uniref:Uncharacterized protein n=1 Tax=Phytophthora pseudosyringae TaxID=221518 RepID=A0A8T1W447_9STRA|nr:hypothetical protein PHYPSEUDO_014392 [Phytophthora pseudosyringae]